MDLDHKGLELLGAEDTLVVVVADTRSHPQVGRLVVLGTLLGRLARGSNAELHHPGEGKTLLESTLAGVPHLESKAIVLGKDKRCRMLRLDVGLLRLRES